jgi:hypothetical protein
LASSGRASAPPRFRSPDEVLDHPLLSKPRKKHILQRWAWDEYLLELASTEAMPEAGWSRLAEIKSALARLDSGPAEQEVLVFSPRELALRAAVANELHWTTSHLEAVPSARCQRLTPS